MEGDLGEGRGNRGREEIDSAFLSPRDLPGEDDKDALQRAPVGYSEGRRLWNLASTSKCGAQSVSRIRWSKWKDFGGVEVGGSWQ